MRVTEFNSALNLEGVREGFLAQKEVGGKSGKRKVEFAVRLPSGASPLKSGPDI